MGEPRFVRFQGTTRSPRGHFPGVFALANGLAREGRLNEAEHRFWRAGNDWFDAVYTDPSTVDPAVYDPDLHPGAVAWFKADAAHLIVRVTGYLELLATHGVECERMESSDPGRIIYEDGDQVVAVPWTTGATAAAADVTGR